MSADEDNSALFQQFLEWKRSMEHTSASNTIPQEEIKEVPSPSSSSSIEEKAPDSAQPASQHSSSQSAGTSPSQASSCDFTAAQYLAKSGKNQKNQSPQATKKFRVSLWFSTFVRILKHVPL